MYQYVVFKADFYIIYFELKYIYYSAEHLSVFPFLMSFLMPKYQGNMAWCH